MRSPVDRALGPGASDPRLATPTGAGREAWATTGRLWRARRSLRSGKSLLGVTRHQTHGDPRSGPLRPGFGAWKPEVSPGAGEGTHHGESSEILRFLSLNCPLSQPRSRRGDGSRQKPEPPGMETRRRGAAFPVRPVWGPRRGPRARGLLPSVPLTTRERVAAGAQQATVALSARSPFASERSWRR